MNRNISPSRRAGKPGRADRRSALLGEILQLGRDNGGLGLMLHQAIGERLGLGPTDIKALDLARQEPSLTAGRLAEITGLSTSAVTALLDRLEERGFIERRRDADDRRKVYVVATGGRDAELARLYGPLARAMTSILADYDEEQLALLVDYLQRTQSAVRQVLAELGTGQPAPARSPTRALPSKRR